MQSGSESNVFVPPVPPRPPEDGRRYIWQEESIFFTSAAEDDDLAFDLIEDGVGSVKEETELKNLELDGLGEFWSLWENTLIEESSKNPYVTTEVKPQVQTAFQTPPSRSLTRDEVIARTMVSELHRKGGSESLVEKIARLKADNINRLQQLERQARSIEDTLASNRDQVKELTKKKVRIEVELETVRNESAILCPSSTHSCRKSGYLHKLQKDAKVRTAKNVDQLQRRWFLLRPNAPQLYYFETSTSRVPSCIINLDGARVHDGDEKNNFDFCIFLGDGSFFKLYTANQNDYDDWMLHLTSVIDDRNAIVDSRENLQSELFSIQKKLIAAAKAEKQRLADAMMAVQHATEERERLERGETISPAKEALVPALGESISELEARKEDVERRLNRNNSEYNKGKLKFGRNLGGKEFCVLDPPAIASRIEGSAHQELEHRKRVLELQIKKITGSLIGITKAHASQTRGVKSLKLSMEELRFQNECLEIYERLEPSLRVEGDDESRDSISIDLGSLGSMSRLNSAASLLQETPPVSPFVSPEPGDGEIRRQISMGSLALAEASDRDDDDASNASSGAAVAGGSDDISVGNDDIANLNDDDGSGGSSKGIENESEAPSRSKMFRSPSSPSFSNTPEESSDPLSEKTSGIIPADADLLTRASAVLSTSHLAKAQVEWGMGRVGHIRRNRSLNDFRSGPLLGESGSSSSQSHSQAGSAKGLKPSSSSSDIGSRVGDVLIPTKDQTLLEFEEISTELELLRLKLENERQRADTLAGEKQKALETLNKQVTSLKALNNEHDSLKKSIEQILESEQREREDRRASHAEREEEESSASSASRRRSGRSGTGSGSGSGGISPRISPSSKRSISTETEGDEEEASSTTRLSESGVPKCQRRARSPPSSTSTSTPPSSLSLDPSMLDLVPAQARAELERVKSKLKERQEAKTRKEEEEDARRERERERFRALIANANGKESGKESSAIPAAPTKEEEEGKERSMAKISRRNERRAKNEEEFQKEVLAYPSSAGKTPSDIVREIEEENRSKTSQSLGAENGDDGSECGDKKGGSPQQSSENDEETPSSNTQEEWLSLDFAEEIRLRQLEKEALELEETKCAQLVGLRMLEAECDAYATLAPPPGVLLKRLGDSDLTAEYEEVGKGLYDNTEDFDYFLFVDDEVADDLASTRDESGVWSVPGMRMVSRGAEEDEEEEEEEDENPDSAKGSAKKKESTPSMMKKIGKGLNDYLEEFWFSDEEDEDLFSFDVFSDLSEEGEGEEEEDGGVGEAESRLKSTSLGGGSGDHKEQDERNSERIQDFLEGRGGDDACDSNSKDIRRRAHSYEQLDEIRRKKELSLVRFENDEVDWGEREREAGSGSGSSPSPSGSSSSSPSTSPTSSRGAAGGVPSKQEKRAIRRRKRAEMVRIRLEQLIFNEK